MIIYFITFFISILLIKLGLNQSEKNKVLSYLFIGLGVVLPCLLAGMRDISVGTDTSGYVINLYNRATITDNFKEYFYIISNYYNASDTAYIFVTYFSQKIFNSFNAFLLIMELIIIVPIFISLKNTCTSKNEIIFGMIIYFFMFYNVTFNMIRQAAAISYLVLGLTYLIKNKKIKAFFCLLLSIMFHKTAVIGIIIYIIFLLLKSNKIKEKGKKTIEYITYFVSIICVVFYKKIIFLLSYLKIYEHGLEYVSKFQKFDFSFTDTALYLFFLLIILKNKSIIERKNKNYSFFVFLGIESIILLQFGANVQYLERISLYLFYPLMIIGVPLIVTDNNKIKLKKEQLLIYIFLFIYWIYIFVVLKSHGTVPYVFK